MTIMKHAQLFVRKGYRILNNSSSSSSNHNIRRNNTQNNPFSRRKNVALFVVVLIQIYCFKKYSQQTQQQTPQPINANKGSRSKSSDNSLKATNIQEDIVPRAKNTSSTAATATATSLKTSTRAAAAAATTISTTTTVGGTSEATEQDRRNEEEMEKTKKTKKTVDDTTVASTNKHNNANADANNDSAAAVVAVAEEKKEKEEGNNNNTPAEKKNLDCMKEVHDSLRGKHETWAQYKVPILNSIVFGASAESENEPTAKATSTTSTTTTTTTTRFVFGIGYIRPKLFFTSPAMYLQLYHKLYSNVTGTWTCRSNTKDDTEDVTTTIDGRVLEHDPDFLTLIVDCPSETTELIYRPPISQYEDVKQFFKKKFVESSDNPTVSYQIPSHLNPNECIQQENDFRKQYINDRMIVCTMVRKPNIQQLNEWLTYYKYIAGFDHIIVYVNEEYQEKEYHQMIGQNNHNDNDQNQQNDPFVHVRYANYPMKKPFFYQIPILNDCLQQYHAAKWIAFMDMDEYFQVMTVDEAKNSNDQNTIMTFLSQKYLHNDTIGGVSIPQWYFGSKGDGSDLTADNQDLPTISKYIYRAPDAFFGIKRQQHERPKCIVKPTKIRYMSVHRPSGLMGDHGHPIAHGNRIYTTNNIIHTVDPYTEIRMNHYRQPTKGVQRHSIDRKPYKPSEVVKDTSMHDRYGSIIQTHLQRLAVKSKTE